jgi:hypothetical protein
VSQANPEQGPSSIKLTIAAAVVGLIAAAVAILAVVPPFAEARILLGQSIDGIRLGETQPVRSQHLRPFRSLSSPGP